MKRLKIRLRRMGVKLWGRMRLWGRMGRLWGILSGKAVLGREGGGGRRWLGVKRGGDRRRGGEGVVEKEIEEG
ncbi:hypothetical protein, partial [Paenibacillus sp. Y412MC10]|uniref:hypothetical protein n=1 Tax=Geobacillus sp. (strain Y412MC10) TaxID=481743 RepID=UPI001C92EE3B